MGQQDATLCLAHLVRGGGHTVPKAAHLGASPTVHLATFPGGLWGHRDALLPSDQNPSRSLCLRSPMEWGDWWSTSWSWGVYAERGQCGTQWVHGHEGWAQGRQGKAWVLEAVGTMGGGTPLPSLLACPTVWGQCLTWGLGVPPRAQPGPGFPAQHQLRGDPWNLVLPSVSSTGLDHGGMSSPN